MNRDRLLELYRKMVELRRFDEMCLEMAMKDLIMDGFHPYQGQEAVAVGIAAALRPDDVMLSNHRPQGHALAKGSTTRQIFCELLGRRGGVSQGIGGPMQFIDSPNRFFCGSIVGSGITVAAGVAMALKREGNGRIAVCFFGDGASNTGSFHEGLNLASIWKLPVLYVCENNQYGEAMPVAEFIPVEKIADRAGAYGMVGETVDGMNLEAVVEAAERTVAMVREGQGPVLLETVTYRFRGHYTADPEHLYRSRDEVAEWRKRDPIAAARQSLGALGVAEAQLDGLDQQIVAQLESDRQWAQQQPFPTAEQAADNVWIPLDQATTNA